MLDAERLKYEFKEHGKALSVMDTCNMDSEDGEFIYTINSAIAELERRGLGLQGGCRKRQKKKERKKPADGVAASPPYHAALNKTPDRTSIRTEGDQI
ncbi:MAG: hypothetical protein R3F51_23245 [Cyanobacteriota/Melainabacteria group bacterium]